MSGPRSEKERAGSAPLARRGWARVFYGPGVRDDRARPVRLCSAFERPDRGDLPALRRAEYDAYTRWERASDRLIRPGSRDRLVLVAAISLWLGGILLLSVWLAIINAPGWAVWVVAVVGAAALAAPLFVWERRQMARLLRHAYLARGLCPACSYALGDVPSDADGCTTCPECGAAWRLAPSPNEPRP